MNILFHATYSNQLEFLNILKKKFKNHNIYTIKDNLDYNKIEVALPTNPFPIIPIVILYINYIE